MQSIYKEDYKNKHRFYNIKNSEKSNSYDSFVHAHYLHSACMHD